MASNIVRKKSLLLKLITYRPTWAALMDIMLFHNFPECIENIFLQIKFNNEHFGKNIVKIYFEKPIKCSFLDSKPSR